MAMNSNRDYTSEKLRKSVSSLTGSLSEQELEIDKILARVRESDREVLPDYLQAFKHEYDSINTKVKLPMINFGSSLPVGTTPVNSPLEKVTEKDIAKAEKYMAMAKGSSFYKIMSNKIGIDDTNITDSPKAFTSTTPNKFVKKMTMLETAKPVPLDVDTSSTSFYKKAELIRMRKMEQATSMAAMSSVSDEYKGKGSSKPNTANGNFVQAKIPAKLSPIALQSELENYLATKLESPMNFNNDVNRLAISVSSESKRNNIISPVSSTPTKNTAYKTPKKNTKNEGLEYNNMSRCKLLTTEDLLVPTDVLNQYKPTLTETGEYFNEKLLHNYNEVKSKYDDNLLVEAKNTVKKKEYYESFVHHVYDETGINLDANVTRKRQYEKGFRFLVYFVYKFKISEAFQWFKIQVNKATKARILHAAITIARYARGMISRSIAQKMREEIKEKLEAERMKRRRERAQRNLRRSVLLCFVRSAISRLRRRIAAKKAFSVTAIQARYRGNKSRKESTEYIAEAKRLRRRAIVIQCAYRQHLARRKHIVMYKISLVNWMLEEQQRVRQMSMQYMCLVGAKMCIVRYYRKFKISKNIKKILYWNRFDCTVFLQSKVRMYLQRKKYLKIIRYRRKNIQKRVDACVTIQRVRRGYVARSLFKVMKQESAAAKKKKLQLKKDLLKRSKLLFIARTGVIKYMPFSYVYLGRKAIAIQRIWRGYRARRRTFLNRINLKIKSRTAHETRMLWGSVNIQRVYRGYIYRRNVMRSLRKLKCIIIQCFYRCARARHLLYKLRAEKAASSMVTRNLKILLSFRRANRARQHRRRLAKKLTIIQNFLLKCSGRSRLIERKYSARVKYETKMSNNTRIDRLLSLMQLKMVQDSIETALNSCPKCFHSTLLPPCNGPFKCMFVGILGIKGRTDRTLLTLNKMDMKSLSKGLAKVDGLIVSGKPAAKIINKTATVSSGLALFDALRMGSIRLIDGYTALSPTDLDIMFNKAMTDASSGSNMAFSDFCNLLQLMAEVHFKQVAKPRESIIAAQLNQNQAGSVKEIKPIAAFKDRETDATSSNDCRLKMLKAFVIDASEPLNNYKLSLGVKMLYCMRNEEWFEELRVWMQEECKAILSSYVIKIQGMFRIWKSRIFKQVMIDRKAAAEIIKVQFENAAIIQRTVRGFVGRRRHAHNAQKFIIKYVPYDQPPYYYNPSTRVSKAIKPKVLLHYECITISLPPTGLANVVNCNHCQDVATVNCIECEDSFCKSCYDTFHCKGMRRLHRNYKFPFCSNCSFQVATKTCLTCILQKPKPGSLQERMSETDRGTFCDTCFVYYHDTREMRNENKANKNNVDKYLFQGSKDAYLVQQSLSLRTCTAHKYDNLVQPCEECNFRAAAWRCFQCQQVYCHKCLTGLHSIGGPFSSHNAELLPYYSIEMHQSYLNDQKEQSMHTKLELARKAMEQKRAEFRAKAIVRIQAWWRGVYYGRQGREFLHIERRKQRRKYRLHKQETVSKRSKLWYQVLDILGKAPELRSDTKEEKLLKHVPIWNRQRARQYIWRNKEDWGFYITEENATGVKGVPRTGFEVGTDEELTDQCRRGGYRLPGVVYFKQNTNIHKTKCDLTRIIKSGELVRVNDQVMVVMNVDNNNNITFDRKWRFKNSRNGELMYRLPCYGNEDFLARSYYRLQYTAFTIVYANPISRQYFNYHSSLFRRLSRFSMYMSGASAKSGDDQDASEWIQYSRKCIKRAQWAENFIIDGNGRPPDLSQAVKRDPTKDELKKEREAAVRAEAAALAKANAPSESKKMKKDAVISDLELEKSQAVIEARVEGERWTATRIELEERRKIEEAMIPEELAKMADDWGEEADIITGNIVYVHKVTNEVLNEMPLSLVTKLKLEAKAEEDRIKMEEAKKMVTSFNKAASSKLKIKR
jgi:hypothetical protein